MAFEYLTEGAVSLSAANWSGSGLAAGGQFSIRKTANDITGGMALGAAVSAIADFHIGRMVNASIGTAASPLQMGISGAFRNDAAGGTLYVDFESTNQDSCALFSQTGFGSVIFTGDGTITQLDWGKGSAQVGASVDLQTTVIAGGTVFVAAGSPTHDSTTILNGVLRTERSFAASQTINVRGGHLKGITPSANIGNATVINVWDGVFEWVGTFGTTVAVNLYGGSLDFSKITTTATLPTLNIWPTASKSVVNSVLNQLTITTVNYRLGATATPGGPSMGGGSGG